MASEQQVKRYLAYWFQLGKRVFIRNGQTALFPKQVIVGDRYSQEFEQMWQQILLPESGDCYLEGTPQTIAELLTSKWDIEPCSRCEMPVPLINVGMPPDSCTCSDLPTWPNTDLPAPREPVNSQDRLSSIRDRLHQADNQLGSQDQASASENRDLPPPDCLNRQTYLRLVRDHSYETTSLPKSVEDLSLKGKKGEL